MLILNGHGPEIRGNKEIAKEAIRYFRDLFSSTNHCNPSNALHNIKLTLTEEMHNIKSTLTEEMNSALLQASTENEIKQALFSIGATRVPKPDGFNAAFYQHYWHILRPALVAEGQKLFALGEMLNQW